MLRQQDTYIGAITLALALAACQAGGPTGGARPGVSARPSTKPVVGAKATPVAPAAPQRLRPLADGVPFSGQVKLDATYLQRAGIASGLTGGEGGARLGVGGARPGPATGELIDAAGRVVAVSGGTIVVPPAAGGLPAAARLTLRGDALISNNGATLVANNGGGFISDNGGGLSGGQGGALIGDSGGGLVANNGGGLRAPAFRLAQAGDSPVAAIAGMWVSVVDVRTGLTLPLGVDTSGAPVYSIYSGGDGRYAAWLPPDAAPFARVVARVPGQRDTRTTFHVLGSATRGEAGLVSTANADVTAYLRLVLARRIVDVLAIDPATIAFAPSEEGPKQAQVAIQLLLPAFAAARATAAEVGFTSLPPDQQLEVALAFADLLSSDLKILGQPITFATYVPFDPASRARFEGRPTLDVLNEFLGAIRAAAVRTVAGRAEPAAYFATRPWLIAANLSRPPGERVAIETASDLVRFCVDEYFSSNDDRQVDKFRNLATDLGLPAAEIDRMRAIGVTITAQLFEAMLKGANGEAEDLTAVAARIVREAGGDFRGLPAGALPPARLATAALPTPPPEPVGWIVDTVVGAPSEAGGIDGGAEARLDGPSALVYDARAAVPTLYVGESGRRTIRRITLPEGGGVQVTTVAGRPGEEGHEDGPGAQARMGGAGGMALDPLGRLYFSDGASQSIRRITFDAAGQALVATIAGNPALAPGVPYDNDAVERAFADGLGRDARFHFPAGLALDGRGGLLVSDTGNWRLRHVALDQAGQPVTTFAGSALRNSLDGSRETARFSGPTALAAAPDGTVYMIDGGMLRQLTPAGQVRIVAGSGAETAERVGFYTNAWFSLPTGLAVDPAGDLVVAEAKGRRLRLVRPDGWVTTLAGDAGAPEGHVDGPAEQARFREPRGVAIAPDGTIYVADVLDHCIRRLRRR